MSLFISSRNSKNGVLASKTWNLIRLICVSSNNNPKEKLKTILKWILTTPVFAFLTWIGVTFYLYVKYCLYLAVDSMKASVSITIS